jgi:ferric-dicitrate binding protein FerR (iron transport regulator)
MSNRTEKVIKSYTQPGAQHPSPERFHQWLTEAPLSDEKEAALRRLWKQTENVATEDTATSWELLKLKLQLARERNVFRRSVWRYAAAVALVLSLAGGSLFLLRAPKEVLFAEYFTGYGKSEIITLPDGSEVMTNSGTLLVYPDNFGVQSRTLYLSGEANFKVVKNAEIPFTVKSKYLEITALGTEFNVSTYAEDRNALATLVNGSIRVTVVDDRSVAVLTPGEQLVYHKQQQIGAIHQVDIDEATAWQRGDMVFRGATLSEIMNVLERKYDVSFQYKTSALSDDRFNFYFKKETSFADIMEIVTTVAGKFDYRVLHRTERAEVRTQGQKPQNK